MGLKAKWPGPGNRADRHPGRMQLTKCIGRNCHSVRIILCALDAKSPKRRHFHPVAYTTFQRKYTFLWKDKKLANFLGNFQGVRIGAKWGRNGAKWGQN